MKKKEFIWIMGTGITVGVLSVLLSALGNPNNMGICVVCFLRDVAGSIGLHQTETVQYIRPEIVGIVLGAICMAFATRSFAPRGGSSPMTRFVLGFFVTVGALMFLGCPLRMVLRIAGGDLNALLGLVGFGVGILTGILFLNNGFSLNKSHPQGILEGLAFPTVNVVLLTLLLVAPGLLVFSKSGPGSLHAPLWISLAAGLVMGALAQKSRLCFVGGIRDAVLFRDFYLLIGFITILATALIGNLILGKFFLSFTDQPIVIRDGLWNILGMGLVGLGSVFLGGCPLRQLVLAGSGNSDSAITVLGMIMGAAICHNFSLASSANGPTANGKIAVILGFIIVLGIAFANLYKRRKLS